MPCCLAHGVSKEEPQGEKGTEIEELEKKIAEANKAVETLQEEVSILH